MLNDRTRDIMDYIRKFARERGYGPTIREIGKAFDIKSTNGVRYHLNLLVKSGHIQRIGKISRGIECIGLSASKLPGIPILGRVAAGQPILAEESHDGLLETEHMFGTPGELFALRVRGDSMIDAGLHENDFVIVKKQESAQPGEMVVALIEDEATVKFYHPRGGHIELRPANDNHRPIIVEGDSKFGIIGVVRGVVRVVGR